MTHITDDTLRALLTSAHADRETYAGQYESLCNWYGRDRVSALAVQLFHGPKTEVAEVDDTDTEADSGQATPDPHVIARFGTLFGAVVTLTSEKTGIPDHETAYRWHCAGCQKNGTFTLLGLDHTRNEANTHAGSCRALPRPAEAS